VVVQIWRSRLPNRITNHETPMNTDIQMPKPPISPTAPRSIFGLWISFVICHSTGPWSHCTLSKSPCIHKLSASERGVDAASLSLLPQLSLNSNLVGSFTLKRPEGRAPTNRQLVDALPQRGCILTLPPERGRSPPAARRSVEVVWSIPEPFHQLCCCGPGRSAVRRWRFQDASGGDGAPVSRGFLPSLVPAPLGLQIAF